MTDDLTIFTPSEKEAYDERELRECALVAELAHEGIIPAHQLPNLHIWMDGERPQLVSTAMERMVWEEYKDD